TMAVKWFPLTVKCLVGQQDRHLELREDARRRSPQDEVAEARVSEAAHDEHLCADFRRMCLKSFANRDTFGTGCGEARVQAGMAQAFSKAVAGILIVERLLAENGYH